MVLSPGWGLIGEEGRDGIYGHPCGIFGHPRPLSRAPPPTPAPRTPWEPGVPKVRLEAGFLYMGEGSVGVCRINVCVHLEFSSCLPPFLGGQQ